MPSTPTASSLLDAIAALPSAGGGTSASGDEPSIQAQLRAWLASTPSVRDIADLFRSLDALRGGASWQATIVEEAPDAWVREWLVVRLAYQRTEEPDDGPSHEVLEALCRRPPSPEQQEIVANALWDRCQTLIERHAQDDEIKQQDWSSVVAAMTVAMLPERNVGDREAVLGFLQKNLVQTGFFDVGQLHLRGLIDDPSTPRILIQALAAQDRCQRLHPYLASLDWVRADGGILAALRTSTSPKTLRALCRHLEGAALSDTFRRLARTSPTTAADLLDEIGPRITQEDIMPLLECSSGAVRLKAIAALGKAGQPSSPAQDAGPARDASAAPLPRPALAPTPRR
jgi:hypothetical protein